jgi:hypothetical protein
MLITDLSAKGRVAIVIGADGHRDAFSATPNLFARFSDLRTAASHQHPRTNQ